MRLHELLPTVSKLSHQDKLRLIDFLLQAVAEEAGCDLEVNVDSDSQKALLNQLTSTPAVVWSPKADKKAILALSDLLIAAQDNGDD